MAKLRLVPVYVLLLTPLVLVGVAVATYAVNFPFWDDYLVQQHLLSIRSGGSLLRRLSLFFDQHWEHRIVWTRLIFYGFYKLNGTLNYAILPWIGLSGLVAVLGLNLRTQRWASEVAGVVQRPGLDSGALLLAGCWKAVGRLLVFYMSRTVQLAVVMMSVEGLFRLVMVFSEPPKDLAVLEDKN